MEIAKETLLNAGADPESIHIINRILSDSGLSIQAKWEKLAFEVLHSDTEYQLLQLLHQKVFSYSEMSDKTPMAWYPTEDIITDSNIGKLCSQMNCNYNEFRKWSVINRSSFWDTIIKKTEISFMKDYSAVIQFDKGLEEPHWLPDAVFNISESCFKDSNMNKPAIIYQPENGSIQSWTYKYLNIVACKVANALVEMGLKKGDSIAIDMPMTAESIAIYLGIIKFGGVVVSIADSLAAVEVDKRLRIANAKLIFTQDVILRARKELPLYNKFNMTTLPTAIVIPAGHSLKVMLRDCDILWEDFLSDKESFESFGCTSSDYCNILFSSGTTGDPKAIPWTHSTPIKCVADGYFHHNLKPGDVVAWPTNLGWMMGPWLIFASLINSCTIALFYGAPGGKEFGTFVQDAKVNMLGLVPSMVKKWIETDCMKGLDWSSINIFSSTGESSNPQDYLWLMCKAGWKPVIEYCGGTEIGGGYFTGTVVQPASPSTFSTTALGLDVIIMDNNGKPNPTGELFIIPPSIGLSTSLINKDHHEVYYLDTPDVLPDYMGSSGVRIGDQFKEYGFAPTIRRHGDEVQQMPNGYFKAMGRADDTMNLGGIKTSSVEIERLLDLVEGVTETAAIAISPKGGGPEELVIYAVLNDNTTIDKNALMAIFQSSITSNLNPLFHIRDVIIIDSLPRTASNKVMRRVLRQDYQDSLQI